jgi:hypothetical protein
MFPSYPSVCRVRQHFQTLGVLVVHMDWLSSASMQMGSLSERNCSDKNSLPTHPSRQLRQQSQANCCQLDFMVISSQVHPILRQMSVAVVDSPLLVNTRFAIAPSRHPRMPTRDDGCCCSTAPTAPLSLCKSVIDAHDVTLSPLRPKGGASVFGRRESGVWQSHSSGPAPVFQRSRRRHTSTAAAVDRCRRKLNDEKWTVLR